MIHAILFMLFIHLGVSIIGYSLSGMEPMEEIGGIFAEDTTETNGILGIVERIGEAGKSLASLVVSAATWDWPMFEGDFAILRLFGVMLSVAVGFGLLSLFRSFLPF